MCHSPAMQVLSWAQFDQAVQQLASRYAGSAVTGVYGVPRGGLCLAVALSHAIDRPLLSAPEPSALIVDDVYETGRNGNGSSHWADRCIRCRLRRRSG